MGYCLGFEVFCTGNVESRQYYYYIEHNPELDTIDPIGYRTCKDNSDF